MILDYNEYVTQSEQYGLNTGPKRSDEKSLFFHKREFCVFCNKRTEKVYSDPGVDTDTLPGVGWHKINGVFTCSCGWWEHTFYGYLDGENQGFKDWAFEIDSAILRKYNIDSNELPIQSLREYLVKKADDIYQIHNSKMEELVASVLGEHFTCEAHVVGKSHDGGVDLILVESDCPIIVQVKRRKRRGKVEPVRLIRELIGATLLKGSKECVFVTTADHFSNEAIKARNMALEKNIVRRFDLIDINKFINLLQLNKVNNTPPWKTLIER